VIRLQTLFKKLSAQRSSAPERLSAEAGAHTFHLLNQGGACFLTLAEKSYPKKLAYQYLEELSNEFNRLYGGEQIDKVTRPYAFIKFGASCSVLILPVKPWECCKCLVLWPHIGQGHSHAKATQPK
jgi:hypothetical protein